MLTEIVRLLRQLAARHFAATHFISAHLTTHFALGIRAAHLLFRFERGKRDAAGEQGLALPRAGSFGGRACGYLRGSHKLPRHKPPI